ncbi:MAG: PAS domain S-box protein [Gemmatimonadales bacterium]
MTNGPMAQLLASRPLGEPPEPAFDRLSRLAGRLLGAPVALVSVVGEEQVFFKSAMGLPEPWASRRSTPIAYSFCRHVAASGAPLVVEDARRDPRLRASPAVRELRWIAYAGVPVTASDGRTVAVLSVADTLPRVWSPRDLSLLTDLAASVATELELEAVTTPGAVPAAAVFEHSALPMGLIHPDGRWVRVNRALAELVGMSPETIEGCPADGLTHPLDRAADHEALRLLRAGEVSSYATEKRLIGAAEASIWVMATVSAIPEGAGAPPHLHITYHDITDRKTAEADLRHREERYRLAANAQEAVWDWDLRTDRIVWSEPPGGSLGWQQSGRAASAAWWYERLHAEDRERVVSGIHAAIARGAEVWSEAYRFRRADGSYAHVRDRAAIVRDEAGDPIRMVGSVLDTSDETGEDLFATGLSQLLEQIAAGLDLGAVLERIVRVAEMRDDRLTVAVLVIGTEGRELRLAAGPSLPPAVRAGLTRLPLDADAGVSAAAATRRARVVFADLAGAGAPAWSAPLVANGVRAVWATPLFATDGSLLGTVEVHYREAREPREAERVLIERVVHLAEIAIERDRNQDALARGMQLLEQVLDSLPVGVWVLGRDGRIMFGNPAGRAIWGGARYVGLDELDTYRGWWADTGEPVAPDEWGAVRAIRHGETSLNEMMHIEAFDGAQRTILNSTVPLRSLGGEIVGAIVVNQDITDQRSAEAALRRSEEQLRQAQKMEAVGQLAGGIAHDFNNLLTGILSYSDLMLQDLRPGDPLRGDLEHIRHAGQRAAALTRQLLAFSRRQVLQPRLLSLNATVTELETMLRGLLGASITLDTALEAGLWYVRADPGQIEQVLVNLVVNSRDAMANGGIVTIATANLQLDAADDARGNGVRPGPYVTLAVRDTGAGMDVPTQARIFEPFFTTKEPGKGTGLGLSTVYGIVEQSGGHIAVESVPGQGATFTIFLPRHDTGPTAESTETSDRRGLPGGSETLLLVEDEEAVRSSVRRLFERQGYRVVEARHGQEALRIMESGAKIDMVVTDLVMPEMGGRELVERLRARHPALKVLFMSGYSEQGVTSDGSLPRGTGFVEKPFTMEQLVRRTREVLDG